MKTTLNTDTFTVSLTEISLDSDSPTRLELDFTATLTRAYLETIHDADTVSDILDDDDVSDITYHFNVALRHNDDLHAIIHDDDYSADTFDYDHAVYTFGQPVIDFVYSICRLLDAPFYKTT